MNDIMLYFQIGKTRFQYRLSNFDALEYMKEAAVMVHEDISKVLDKASNPILRFCRDDMGNIMEKIYAFQFTQSIWNLHISGSIHMQLHHAASLGFLAQELHEVVDNQLLRLDPEATDQALGLTYSAETFLIESYGMYPAAKEQRG